jgi:hypothetical protein
MLELRMAYHDPRDDSSTRSSVVKPVGNPQQVVVQSVDVKEFYNQSSDFQPSRVTPIPGLKNTMPAILKPDPMWAHRWPDMGPYKGMTPQPFAWEKHQMDGLEAITTGQRDRYRAAVERLNELERSLASMRRSAGDEAAIGRVAMLQSQAARIRTILEEASGMEDEFLDMAVDDATSELDQLEERIGRAGGSAPTDYTTVAWVAGAVAVGIGLWWWSNRPEF